MQGIAELVAEAQRSAEANPDRQAWVEREREREARKTKTDLMQLMRQIGQNALSGAYGDQIKFIAQDTFGTTQPHQCDARFLRDAVVLIQLTRRCLKDGVKPPTLDSIDAKRRAREQNEWVRRETDDLDDFSESYDGRYGT